MIEDLKSNDRAVILTGLRDVLAGAIEVADPGEVAALVRQMVSVSAELAALTRPEVSAVDDISDARAKRRTSAHHAHPTTRVKQRKS